MARTSVYYTNAALADLRRIRAFLRPKSPRAAEPAVITIRGAIRRLTDFPESGRQRLDGDPSHRELPIRFGRSGYVALYGFDGGEIVVISIRHQSEAGY